MTYGKVHQFPCMEYGCVSLHPAPLCAHPMGSYQHLIIIIIKLSEETTMTTTTTNVNRPRIKAVRVNPSEYAAIGTNPIRKPKVYVRNNKPNRMKAIMVAASFATLLGFYADGGYESMGQDWCREIFMVSRLYQTDQRA